MRDYPYVCGADIQSIANKEFVRFETTKARDIVVALDKSNIPFSAKYNDTEIILTYDGNYKDSVDEITAKVMSENYDELLREIREKKSDDYLLLLSEVADVLNTTVGTLKARPVEIQELLCKAYADFWICDTPTIQRELDRYITVNGRTLQDVQEHEKSKVQEKAPKAPEVSKTGEPPTFEELIADYFRRNGHAHFTRESHKHLSEIARRRQQAEQEQISQNEEIERRKRP